MQQGTNSVLIASPIARGHFRGAVARGHFRGHLRGPRI